MFKKLSLILTITTSLTLPSLSLAQSVNSYNTNEVINAVTHNFEDTKTSGRGVDKNRPEDDMSNDLYTIQEVDVNQIDNGKLKGKGFGGNN